MVIYNSTDIDAIIFEIKNNKALIAPTDTVPGILAKKKSLIYQIKKRNRSKRIIKFICSWEQVKDINNTFIKLARYFWPGNLTIIKNGISYRAPNNKFLLELLSKTGPLYCSSANLSGKKIIKNYKEAQECFGLQNTNIIFLEGNYFSNLPSTIYDIDRDKILRQGEITYEQIKYVIKN